MKKLFFIFTLPSFFLNASAQINFSENVKRFIDYDTSILVLRHVLLIKGTGEAALPNQTIVLKRSKIDWVGDDHKAVIPAQSQVLDLSGKALLPGWVMLHEHMYNSAASFDPIYLHLKQLPVTFPPMYLAGGATTIRTCGSIEPYSDLSIKRDIDAGKMAGPSLELTAPYLEGEGGMYPQMNILKTPADAVAFVNYWADQGFTSFKAYMAIKKDVLKAAIETVHKRGLKITGHLCSITFREAAELGIDQLEHGFSTCNDFVSGKKENACPTGAERYNSLARMRLDSDSLKSLIQLLVKKNIIITSTLQVREGSTTTQPPPDPLVLDILAPDSRDYYLKRYIATKTAKSPSPIDKAFPVFAKMEKLFYDAGGLLTVGTDPTGNGGVLPGYGNWRNIELLVEAAGFTPLEAIKIATLNGAKALGIEKETGTIEKGKQADLIVIDGDPSKNISEIRKVVWVFKDGVGYNSKRLFESVKGKVGFN